MASRQAAAEFGHGRIFVDQLLLQRQCRAELGLRFRSIALLQQQGAEVAVASRQIAAEVGDGGIVVGQLLVLGQGGTELGLRLG